MKNALILAYDFKPLNTICANRTNSWFKYFKKYDLNPIVFTRKWSNPINKANDYLFDENGEFTKEETDLGIIYRAPFKKSIFEKINFYLSNSNFIFARKIITLISLFINHIPFFNIEKKFYLTYIEQIISNENIDYLIVSGEPFILFKYAQIISKKYNIPYILDYRDSWSLNPMSNDRTIFKFINKMNFFFEKKYLKNALFFSTASEAIANDIETKILKKKNIVIENGYDKELYDNSSIEEDFQNFTIIYTGSVYDIQPVQPFLEGLEEFILKNKDKHFKVIFIGILFRPNQNTAKIVDLQSKYPNKIEIKGKVPLIESIKFQKMATVLLKFSIREATKGFYAGKFYEYHACNKPILNIFSNKEKCKTDYFKENNIQTFAYSKESVFTALENLYNDFSTGKTNFIPLSESQKNSFSRQNMAKKLVQYILQN